MFEGLGWRVNESRFFNIRSETVLGASLQNVQLGSPSPAETADRWSPLRFSTWNEESQNWSIRVLCKVVSRLLECVREINFCDSRELFQSFTQETDQHGIHTAATRLPVKRP